MICQKCSHQNDENAKVCVSCGTALNKPKVVAPVINAQPTTEKVNQTYTQNQQNSYNTQNGAYSQGYQNNAGQNAQHNQYQQNAHYYYQPPVDTGSVGWVVLGAFYPLIGLILYLVWKDVKPKSAKQAGKGAIIGVCISAGVSILSVLLPVIIYIFMAVLGVAGSLGMAGAAGALCIL